MVNNVVFLINRSEKTAGTRGSSLGPDAIMTVAKQRGSNIFEENKVQVLQNVNHYLDHPTQFPRAKFIDGTLDIYNELNQEVSKLLNRESFPFILAGDHGSAGGTIAGNKTAYPDKRLGVVWVDAHADIHTPYTSPSGNIHGMPLATALGIDNLECKIHDVDELTAAYWDQLKTVGSPAPKILPEDIVYVAVRDIEAQESAIITRLNIKTIDIAYVRDNGIDKTVEVINSHLSHCDIIYVSFDVDSMCPILSSYGTGTPVENGLDPEEAKDILVSLAKNPKTICVEVVEVNPCLDRKINTMAEIALGIIEAVVSTIKK